MLTKIKQWYNGKLWFIIARQRNTIKELKASVKSYKGWNTRQREEIKLLKEKCYE